MNRDRILRLLVHLLAAAALILIPSLLAIWPGWNPRGPTILFVSLFVFLFALAYLVVALPLVLGGQASEPGLERVALLGIAAFGGAFAIVAFAQWWLPSIAGSEFPARIAFTALAMGMAFLLVLFAIRNAHAWKILILLPVVVAGVLAQVVLRSRTPQPIREVTYVDTSLYVLKSTTYRRWIEDANTRGGAIVPFGDGYLLASGDGWMYFVRESESGIALEIDKLKYRVPYNPDEFRDGARRLFGEAWRDNSMDKLRIADLLVQPRSDGSLRLFVSHHYWKQQEECTVVRVSALEGGARELLDPSGKLVWRTLYETTPCLALNVGGRSGMRFGGLQLGGALALLGDDELLMTVGDHEFDGWTRTPALPQDATNSYGKIMLIRLDTAQAEIYSSGHRNPQGLYIGADGTVWSVEHGPKGGDELNRIRRGMDYGWPAVTYGTDYRLHIWPSNPEPGRHEGFEKPTLAFVPSIAVSQLTGVDGRLFDAWRGDLLVGSFFGGLIRTRLEDGRVIFTEPIRIPGRIRDVTEGPDGRILIWTDENVLNFLEPAASGSAESLVSQCTACHALADGDRVAAAPNLLGIVGRPVASVKGYGYSEAMTRFGGRWTEERLDRFLADPEGTVPGTTMRIEGIVDAGQRGQIIEFLERRGEEGPQPH